MRAQKDPALEVQINDDGLEELAVSPLNGRQVFHRNYYSFSNRHGSPVIFLYRSRIL